MKTERLEYRGWGVEVQRKAFRRSISIVLKPGKPVQVRASIGTTWHAIIAFLESRADWIDKHLGKFADAEKILPKKELVVGNKYPYLGQELELSLALTPREKMFFAVIDEKLVLHLPRELFLKKPKELVFAHGALREFYQKSAHSYLKSKLLYWIEHTGLRPRALQIKETKTRWGSCHPDGKLTLNWRLMVYRPEVIDYVIVHELCHLREMNHSKKFWNLVEGFYPDAKVCIREIREQHRHADFLEKIPTIKPIDL